MVSEPDIWSEWLLNRRSGGDPEMRRRVLENLRPTRDRVITNAHVQPGDIVLDVGCGDGMIGFGVLEKHPDSFVIFSDISQPLLEICESIAIDAGLSARCQFLLADATQLSKVPDASVDSVTLRSVLIYVPDKLAANREFHRVLRPGGRLSYFEPINALAAESPDRSVSFWGYDATAVAGLAAKVAEVFTRIQGPNDPMMNFQERDLVGFAEDAGFESVHLEVDIRFARRIPEHYQLTWEQWLKQSGNPKIPSIGEAIEQSLSAAERSEFEADIRPQVESGRGIFRNGFAFLSATR